MLKMLISMFVTQNKLGMIPDAPINETMEQKEAREKRENAIREEMLAKARQEAETQIAKRANTLSERANRVTDAMLGHRSENVVESAKITLKEAGGFLLQATLWAGGAAAIGFAGAYGYEKGKQLANPNQGGNQGGGDNDNREGMSRSEAGARGGRASAGGR